jgi:predicted nucleic acid-binding protein
MIRRTFIWPYGDKAAEEFGRIFTALKRAGRPVQQIDVQIGAMARARCPTA